MGINKFLAGSIKKILPNNLFIYRGGKNCAGVALTIDDGPYPKNTDNILNILRKYNVKATFFMNGKGIEEYSNSFMKVIKEGHEIGNHFYRHTPVTKLTYRELEKEIVQWKDVINNFMTSHNNFPRLIRPPHGRLDLKTLWYAWKYHWTITYWSFDTRDLDGMPFQENRAVLEAMPVSNGDIILLHEDAKHIEELLEYIITRYMSRGLTFCKVSDLI